MRLPIGIEIGGDHESVVAEHRVDQRLVAVAVVGREHAIVDRIEHVFQARRHRRGIATAKAGGAFGCDVRRGQAEDEDVFETDRFADLDVGAVERADRERAVQRHFHVARAGCLHAGRGNLLGEIRRRNDGFREADVVVRQERDLEPVADIGIVVDDVRDIVGELDDQLGPRIARRRLAGEDLDTRRVGRTGIALDLPIDRGRRDDIQQLALVLVDALDLHVEQRVRADDNAEPILDHRRQGLLAVPAQLGDAVLHRRIVDKGLEPAQQIGLIENAG